MIRGIYAAASGMVANFRRQMVLTNNVTNVSTPGYKQDVTASSEFASMLIAKQHGTEGSIGPWDEVGPTGAGTELDVVRIDMSQGALTETGNPLDLAISGPGYFAVQGQDGATLYTRNGTFFRDAAGTLVASDGSPVLGDNGPIQIGPGEIFVGPDGTIMAGDQVAGRIRIVDFDPQEKMVKLGGSYLVPQNAGAQEQPAQGAAISQGFLEHSNVDLGQAMIDMMSAMRSYEASQRMTQLQDQTLAAAVNEVGKV